MANLGRWGECLSPESQNTTAFPQDGETAQIHPWFHVMLSSSVKGAFWFQTQRWWVYKPPPESIYHDIWICFRSRHIHHPFYAFEQKSCYNPFPWYSSMSFLARKTIPLSTNLTSHLAMVKLLNLMLTFVRISNKMPSHHIVRPPKFPHPFSKFYQQKTTKCLVAMLPPKPSPWPQRP